MLQILQPSAHHASSGSFLHAWVHSTQEKGFKCATHTCPPHLQAIMWGTPAQMWTEEKDAPLGGILALLQSLSSYLQGSSSSLSSKNNTSDRRCGQSLPSSPARGVAAGQQWGSPSVPPTPVYKTRAHKVLHKAGTSPFFLSVCDPSP